MSREHQRYSIANQSDAIEKYAVEHNFTIVKRFVDPGKSGLTLSGRMGLRNLLLEVLSGEAEFAHVLVYDVSRWGRFQDADESAYYEYTCKKANVRLHYCVEQFENDGSPYSTLIKALKRMMAGEFSRELSVKVFNGQARLARMGYWQGGSAGYGLRRQIVDGEGCRKAVLKAGEFKQLQLDRVILVPGPKNELAVIREIFRLFAIERKSQDEVAKILNARRIRLEPETRVPNPKWTRTRVHEILTNPKYVGANVYNRKSCKLNQKVVKNCAADWIRRDAAFTQIISPDLFAQAQKILRLRRTYLNNEEILDRLRWLLKRAGKLTCTLINEDAATPCVRTIEAHFNTLLEAYKLVGYQPTGRFYGVNKRASQVRTQRINSLSQELRDAVDSGRLRRTFDIPALVRACPGWATKSYTAFAAHHAVPGSTGIRGLLVRVSRGRYRLNR
jgi:DNA invertase Pin-like site-specific DNA recombinase